MTISIKLTHHWYEGSELIILESGTRIWRINGRNGKREYTKRNDENDDSICLQDLEICFSIMSQENFPANIAVSLLNTKLPRNTRLYQRDTGDVCTGVVEMLESKQEEHCKLDNYRDLFHAIGSDYKSDIIIIRDDEGNIIEKCPGHPDSVDITDDNKITYGYYR